ncbi:MAG: helicase-related protein [Solirubrobacteraceae bacterium]|jgi:superfamily II DNA or RNA helicase
MLVLRPLGATDDEIVGILPELECVDPAVFPPPDPARVGDARSARLLRNALRLGFRSSAGPFRSFGHLAVEPRPYQLVPLMLALRLDPVRLLIADDVGIGKTIEAGLIARELLDRGEVQRLAVLCPPHLAEQWQHELVSKFHIDAELVLPSTTRRLERGLAANESLFERYPHVVISTDFIKTDSRREDFVRTCPELILVDEAHTFAPGAAGRGRHQRYELLTRLAAHDSRHIVLTTATPHSGKEDAFRSLLALLDPTLADLPEDLSGGARQADRRRLARHLVQRRRGDILSYLDVDTPFPERIASETSYQLSPEQRKLFDRALNYCRESVLSERGDKRRQRVRWWSALALLRALGSSPAAAAMALRTRSAAAGTADTDEADDLGRRTVFDQAGEEESETVDVTPGADDAEDDACAEEISGRRRRLLTLARDAEALAGDNDSKLQGAIQLVGQLLDEGHNPIIFCRFIATAEYLAQHLRLSIGKKTEVVAVTGMMAPADREARVTQLATHKRRLLVATDCLSEGINLQDAFDAVVHYDLAWNPTRHEQREGRVDRYGQPRPRVRTVTYFGANSPIDGIVLEVLLRKHEIIRRSLGVSVPVPMDTDAVSEAILEGLITRGLPDDSVFEQLSLIEDISTPQKVEFHDRWDQAAEREKRSRTVFAQASIQVDEVARELEAANSAVGDAESVRQFVTDTLRAHGASVTERPDRSLSADLRECPAAYTDAVGVARLEARFDITGPEDSLLLTRTHPIVEALATQTLNEALDPLIDSPASRCGVIRTREVERRTTLLLVRLRFHVDTRRGRESRILLAEDAAILAFTGTPDAPQWLPAREAEALVGAQPRANMQPELAIRQASTAVAGLEHLKPALEEVAAARANALRAAHERVRATVRTAGTVAVSAQLPIDVLGVYVMLPIAAD